MFKSGFLGFLRGKNKKW